MQRHKGKVQKAVQAENPKGRSGWLKSCSREDTKRTTRDLWTKKPPGGPEGPTWTLSREKWRHHSKILSYSMCIYIYSMCMCIYIYICISLDLPTQSIWICKNCKVLAMPPPLLSPWLSAARCTAMLCNQRRVLRTWPGEASMFT